MCCQYKKMARKVPETEAKQGRMQSKQQKIKERSAITHFQTESKSIKYKQGKAEKECDNREKVHSEAQQAC